MPASSGARRSNRKGQYSCDFCRIRKLRCDRPLPCTSCKSRGKTCHFGSVSTPESTVNTFPSLGSPVSDQSTLLAEIQAFRRQAEELERRVVQTITDTRMLSQPHHDNDASLLSTASTQPAGRRSAHSDLGHVRDAVAHLECVCMGQSSHEPFTSDDLVVKIEHIRAIPQAQTYTTQLGKTTPIVWLPAHTEATVLLESYITHLSYIQHVVHYPSLPATIDEVYYQIDNQQHIKRGSLILLLSIIASATQVWAPGGRGNEHSLFLSSAQATAQTPLWIKATYAVLNAAQNDAVLALESIQGIIILSFVICNLEGVSLRYRALISNGLLLCRELGLHRIDQDSDSPVDNSLKSEIGRRVWWYLVATDWLLAAKYGGPGEGVYQTHPHQMMVNKPRNISDLDLLGNCSQPDLPISQPTDMSYFLQRIRLAEIARNMVDNNLSGAKSSGRPSYARIMAMDSELEQMIRNIPAFLQLDSYTDSPDLNEGSDIFIQAYFLNSLIYTQRCKLHLTSLTSGPSSHPAHASSRGICLNSARRIIHGETQLLQSQHPFIRVRLRLAATLHTVFMAGIVLFMDACINSNNSTEDDILNSDVAEALRIIEDAGSYSLAAANLHESLMQILVKHRSHRQESGASVAAAPALEMNANMGTLASHSWSAPLNLGPSPVQLRRDGPVTEGFLSTTSDGALPVADTQPAQELNDMYLGVVQWDDLFSGLVSSPFF